MENLNLILPEIFLSISIFIALLLGVFFKNSYNLISKTSYIILIALILIIINSFNVSGKLFSESFVINSYVNFFKVLILAGTLFIMIISQNYIRDMKINYFEYPLLILLSVLGMFIMIGANDLILFT